MAIWESVLFEGIRFRGTVDESEHLQQGEQMKQFLERFATLQPAVFRGLIVAIVSLLASVGILVSPELADSLVGVISGLSALVAALWIRPAVTPNNKVLAYVPDPEHPRAIASGEATTTAPDGVILDAVRYDPRHDAQE